MTNLPTNSLPSSKNEAALAERLAKLSPEQRALLENRLREKQSSAAAGLGQPSISPRSGDVAELSAQQERLWVFAQLQPAHPGNNRPQAYRIHGSLNIDLLRNAIDAVLARHELLRGRIKVTDGKPSWVIKPTVELDLPPIDLSNLPDAEAQLIPDMRRTTEIPFNLETAPLVRAALYRLAADEYVLLLVCHHLLFDGWSAGVLLNELAALYTEAPALAPLLIQVLDYAAWQRSQFGESSFQTQLDYWRKVFEPLPAPLNLPTDHGRPPQRMFNTGVTHLELEPPLVEALRALAKDQRVTVFMTLLAGFYILLYRYTGETDIVVGSPTAQRLQPALENLIGFFASTLPLRLNLSDNPSFTGLLARVRAMTLQAYAHQDVPEETLIESLSPERVGNFASLYQTTFNFESSPLMHPYSAGNIELAPYPFTYPIAIHDLDVELTERDGKLIFEFAYDADVFAPATITRFANHYRGLLHTLVGAPDQAIATLPILDEQERQKLLIDWQGDQKAYPRQQTLSDLIEQTVARTPDAIALHSGDQTLTYRELNERANRLAHHLKKIGVASETLVGICCERSPEMLIGLLAILKAGGAYLPLDPAYPKDRLAFMLEDGQVGFLLTQRQFIATLPKNHAQFVLLDEDWDEPSTNLESTTRASNLIYVIYTSGSTGKPKGVMLTHQNIVNFIYAMDACVQHDSPGIWLAVTSISFDISVLELFWTLARGFTVVLYTGAESSATVTDLSMIDLMLRHKVTHFQCTPSLASMLLLDTKSQQALGALRQLFVGGEALSAALAAQLRQVVAGEIRNMFGPTETAVWSSTYLLSGDRLSIGRPIANTELYVLDANFLPVPIGVAGELFIGGDGLARGYLNRPELTRERFVAHPFRPNSDARLYRTGDLVRYFVDGNLEYLGRIDHQVKIRGHRIELGEIEAALAAHPSIREAVVVAREMSSGDIQLIGYLIPRDSALPSPSNEELRRHLATTLPDYMVPTFFVTMEAFPMTPNRKIDRQRLPAPSSWNTPAADPARPRSDVEARLLEIWKEVLGQQAVGIDDSFFELGGHSLLSVQLMAKIHKTFQKQLPLAALFRAPTVAQLALLLEHDNQQPSQSLVTIQPHGSSPPVFFIHGLGGNVLNYYSLAKHLGTDQPVYGLQAQGVDGLTPPLTRMEDIAARYVREILNVQPSGPYRIGGISFGGAAAYEVAQQLHSLGHQVSLLAIFDMTPRIEEPGDRLKKLLNSLRFNQRRFFYLGSTLLRLPAGEKLKYIRTKLPAKLRTFRRVRNTRQWQSDYQRYLEEETDGNLPVELKNVSEACRMASMKYQPKPYPGRVALFLAKDYPIRLIEPIDVWKKLALGGCEALHVPGTHVTMLNEPHVQELAALLKSLLTPAE